MAVAIGGTWAWLYSIKAAPCAWCIPVMFALLGTDRAYDIIRSFDAFHEYIFKLGTAFSKDGAPEALHGKEGTTTYMVYERKCAVLDDLSSRDCGGRAHEIRASRVIALPSFHFFCANSLIASVIFLKSAKSVTTSAGSLGDGDHLQSRLIPAWTLSVQSENQTSLTKPWLINGSANHSSKALGRWVTSLFVKRSARSGTRLLRNCLTMCAMRWKKVAQTDVY